MRRLLTILAIAGAAAAPGCGGGDDGGGGDDDAQVREVVKNYLTALGAGNGRRACDQLTPAAQKEAVEIVTAAFPDMGDLECEDAMGDLSDDAAPETKQSMLNPVVSDVKVDGDRASARIRGLSERARLSRVEEDWKLSRTLTG